MQETRHPELLVTAKDIEEIKQLIDAGADAINIGGEEYGLRMPGNFTLEMIGQATELAHSHGVKVYVSMNALLHNDHLHQLESYIKTLAEFKVDAIVYGDPAILLTASQLAPEIKLHWNTETTSTNYTTVNYWAKKGATRAVLARELSLEEVIDVKKHVQIEVQAQIHGLTCIFHSKRTLVSSYLDHITHQEEKKASKESNLFLREHKRPDEKYPVFEDIHGTHIMSNDEISMIEHLNLLIDAGIDSLKIEGLLLPTDYLVYLTKTYRQAIDLYLEKQEIPFNNEEIEKAQKNKRPLTTGFYFKEQIY